MEIYLGNEHVIDMGQQFITGFKKASKKATILTGRPGIGKTQAVKYLAEQNNLILDIFNASDKRKKEDIKNISLHTQMASRIVCLDECEGMKTADLKKMIQRTKVPLFLCCNYLEKLDWEIRKMCSVIKVERPPWWVFKDYMCHLVGGPEDPVEDEFLNDLAKKALSFRHAQNLVEDPDDEGTEMFMTEDEQIAASLSGKHISRFNMKPDELIFWMHDNADDPDLISKADQMLEYSFLGSYRYWKYAYRLLGEARSSRSPTYPRTFILMGKAKREHNKREKERQKQIEKEEDGIGDVLDEAFLEELVVQIEEEEELEELVTEAQTEEKQQASLNDWL